MTLSELDRLRELSNQALAKYRTQRDATDLEHLLSLRNMIEQALTQWWAQGCKDPNPEADNGA